MVSVAFPGHRTCESGIEAAVDLANGRNARISLLAIAMPPSLPVRAGLAFAPVSPTRLRQHAIDEATERCRELLRRVPASNPVAFTVRYGHPAAVLAEIEPDLADTGATLLLHSELFRARKLRRMVEDWKRSGLELGVV